MVLVASDGEWTRRRAGGAAGARRIGEQLHIPVYDVQKVGYPQRMRDYDARRLRPNGALATIWKTADTVPAVPLLCRGHDGRAFVHNGEVFDRHLRAGQPRWPDGGDGARLARLPRAVGRCHAAARRPVPGDPLRQPRRRAVVVAETATGYTMACLADDLAAVIDAVSPAEPVHVIGHDWGSVPTWEYLSRPGPSDRIASFTSVSGPSMDHFVGWIFDSLSAPPAPELPPCIEPGHSAGVLASFSLPVLRPRSCARLDRDGAQRMLP